ncbi:hypothetical protein L1987_77413 [Smallanthus sonchifolius]|uniref:Uncharacterized protein n=1 Tax=Smallanthus sonchifolius TaxID=185202 RepID=A0ACB8ZA46_9ASTR|nr:hypothetical protein L1987_77413 [Smallanthus sonchifolius]
MWSQERVTIGCGRGWWHLNSGTRLCSSGEGMMCGGKVGIVVLGCGDVDEGSSGSDERIVRIHCEYVKSINNSCLDVAFIYPPGEHNVIEVDKEAFDNCIVPPAAKVLTSGQDNIKLDAPGTRWFICGIGQHCKEHGMKIQIDVSPPHNFKNFDVGSEKGWTTNVDYQAWAAGEIFDVGDKLDAPGGIRFISGIGKDCENGMKLFIKVKDSDEKPKPSELQGGRKLVPAS